MIVNKEQVIQRWFEFYVEKFDKGEEDNYDDRQDEDLLDMVHTAEPLDEPLSDVVVEIANGRLTLEWGKEFKWTLLERTGDI